MKVYVSTIIEKDNKILLIKEAKKQCYGKWNFPSGHVEENEYIREAAVREVKEETNLDVRLDKLISIYNNVFEGSYSISFVFTSIIEKNNEILFNKNEILEAKWFSFEEIEDIKSDFRDEEYMVDALSKYINKKEISLNYLVDR